MCCCLGSLAAGIVRSLQGDRFRAREATTGLLESKGDSQLRYGLLQARAAHATLAGIVQGVGCFEFKRTNKYNQNPSTPQLCYSVTTAELLGGATNTCQHLNENVCAGFVALRPVLSIVNASSLLLCAQKSPEKRWKQRRIDRGQSTGL